jgi:hypothetical protein
VLIKRKRAFVSLKYDLDLDSGSGAVSKGEKIRVQNV